MSSTLLFGLNQPHVKARIWSAVYADGIGPSEYGPGSWDERLSVPPNWSIGFQGVPPGHTVVYFSAEGYDPQTFETVMPDDGAKEIRLVKSPVVLKRLRVDGRHFVTDDGRVDLRLADCFQGPDRFEAGEDLRPIFAQLQAEGFNGIRVFGTDKAIPAQLSRPTFRANPAKIPGFCHLAGDYGLYVLWVVFTDGVVPEAEQLDYYLAVTDGLRAEPNTLLSLVNEYTEHENYVERSRFPKPLGMAASSGSAGMDQPTSPPHWDFDEFHPRRDRPNSIKDCCVVDHPNYLQGMAVLIDEPDRFGSDGNPDAEYCGLQAGASVESAAGMCFHSKRGVYAQLLDDATLGPARRFLAALKGH